MEKKQVKSSLGITDMNGISADDDRTCALSDMNCLDNQDPKNFHLNDMNAVAGDEDTTCALDDMNCLGEDK